MYIEEISAWKLEGFDREMNPNSQNSLLKEMTLAPIDLVLFIKFYLENYLLLI